VGRGGGGALGDCGGWHGIRVGRLGLRGGGGGGPRTRVEGGSKKGQWLGLKRSADGGHVVMEEPQRALTAKFLTSPIFKVTSYITFTRALTFQNFDQAAEEHAQREADAAKRAVELNAHREAGLVATQV
jgi:hypothetical protein